MRFSYRRFVLYIILLLVFVCFLWFNGKLGKRSTKPTISTTSEPTTTTKPIQIPQLYTDTVFDSSNPELFKCAAELNKTQPPFPALLIDVDFLKEVSEEGCHIPEGALKVAVSINLVDSINRFDHPRFDIMFYENSTDRDYIKLFGKETRAIPHLPLASLGNWTMPKEVSLFAEYWRRSPFRECLAVDMKRTVKEQVLPVLDSLNALSELRKLLVTLGMFPFLIEGTFLGWYRECGLIPHTTDVDFAVFFEQYDPLLLDLLIAGQTKFNVLRTVGKVDDNYELTVNLKEKWDPTMDIFLMYTNGVNESWVGGTLTDGHKYNFVFPKYDPYCSADMLGHHYWVTCTPQEMAEFVYGDFKSDSPSDSYSWTYQLNTRDAGMFENKSFAGLYYNALQSASYSTLFESWPLVYVLFCFIY